MAYIPAMKASLSAHGAIVGNTIRDDEPSKLPHHGVSEPSLRAGASLHVRGRRRPAISQRTNPEQREAVETLDAPYWFWPAPAPARRVLTRASPTY